MTCLQLLIMEVNDIIEGPASKVFGGYLRVEEANEKRSLGLSVFFCHVGGQLQQKLWLYTSSDAVPTCT
jgi:hypothetical protein